MSRNFDAVLANQSGASYRSENNDWAQDWLTNRSGAGVPATNAAYGTYFNTTTGLMYITNSANNAYASLYSSTGVFAPGDGTASLPVYAFASDLTTGHYLITTGQLGVTVTGALVDKTTATQRYFYSTNVYIENTATVPLILYKKVASGTHILRFDAYNSSNAETGYSAVGNSVTTATAGSEEGALFIQARRAGTLTTHTTFNGTGSVTTGSANTVITNTTGTIRHAAIEQNAATSGQVLAWNGAVWAPAAPSAGTLTGSGTTNTVAKFTSSSALGNSLITDSGTVVTITGATEFTINRDSGAAQLTLLSARTSASTHAFISGRAARGTIASPTALVSGDVVFLIDARCYHTTGTPGYAQTASIVFFTDGTESGNFVPTALVFKTSTASVAATERMRINTTGEVGIGMTAVRTLDVTGTFGATGAATFGSTITAGSSAIVLTLSTGYLKHAAIEQNGATSGQVLAWNGTVWAPAAGGSVSGGSVNMAVQQAKLPQSAAARIDGGQKRWRLLYLINTGQYADWQFQMPDTYSGTLYATLIWSMDTATANNVTWEVSVMANADGETIETDSFDTVNSSTVAVPGTAGHQKTTTITLTNKDSVAASEMVMIRVKRNDNSAAGDAELLGLRIWWA